jgi:hypothetical protein
MSGEEILKKINQLYIYIYIIVKNNFFIKCLLLLEINFLNLQKNKL